MSGSGEDGRNTPTEGRERAGPEDEVIAEVSTYDPVRRKGFMKRLDHPTHNRVHFALGMLPGDFKQPVIEISRRLNRVKGQPGLMADNVFNELMNRIRSMVVGQRFSFKAKRRKNGQLVILRRTVRHLE